MITTATLTKRALFQHYMEVRQRMSQRAVSVELAMSQADVPDIAEVVAANAPRITLCSIKAITRHVCCHFGLSEAEIFSGSRRKNDALARHIIFYIARKTTGLSFPQIGKRMNKDHTSVLHGYGRIEDRMKSDPEFAAMITEMIGILRGHAQRAMQEVAERQEQYLRG